MADILYQGRTTGRPQMQRGEGVAAIRDKNVLNETLPLSPGELAATHSQPKMYSDFLATIYSPNWWVL